MPGSSEQSIVSISAKSTDYAFAREVHRYLAGRGVNIVFNEESLPELGSSDYRKAIDEALERAQHMIVVTSSRENVCSPWVEAEWGLFINEKRSGHKRANIITVVVDGLGPAHLPPSLRYYEVMNCEQDSLDGLLKYVQ